MTEKQIIDRLDSINLSLRQKKDLIDIIKDITANSAGGGGTSTDKDFLTILVDRGTQTVTVNDKQFLISSSSSSSTECFIEISNKELYNYLFNINMPIFIKDIDNDFSIAGYATCLFEDIAIMLEVYITDGAFTIVVHNQ